MREPTREPESIEVCRNLARYGGEYDAWYWWDSDGNLHEAHPETVLAAYDELKAALAVAEAECLEQARLNGMGSEREAALLGKLATLEADRARLAHEFAVLKLRDERTAELLADKVEHLAVAQQVIEVVTDLVASSTVVDETLRQALETYRASTRMTSVQTLNG